MKLMKSCTDNGGDVGAETWEWDCVCCVDAGRILSGEREMGRGWGIGYKDLLFPT